MTLLLLAALFLPLFPLSIVWHALSARVRHPLWRAAFLLAWPQIGVSLLPAAAQAIPSWFTAWALASAGLYALRLVTVRELARWAAFLASSALALTWALAAAGVAKPWLFALCLSLPAALLALLDGPLSSRFGAAYAGLPGGLAERLPRLAGVLSAVVLAAVATPPFPGFFLMLDLMTRLALPAAIAVLLVWLIWGWAAVRLLQGFVFGGANRPVPAVGDLGRAAALGYAGTLAVCVVAGLYLTGGGL